MTNLISLSLSAGLTIAETEIKDSMGSTLISHMDRKERIKLISEEYFKCINKLGQKNKEEIDSVTEINFLSEEIASYKWLKDSHLKLIFNRAAKGEFSEGNVFFTIANFNQWVKKFYAELQKVEKKLIETKVKEESKPMPSDEELKRQACQSANDYADSIAKAKEEGKEYKFPYGGLHHLCRFLIKFELFHPSRQTMLDMYEANKVQFSHLQGEDWKRMVYSDLYIKFVSDMADFGVRFNDKFELE